MLTALPLAAALHRGVFFPHGGWALGGVAAWLREDPSLPWAVSIVCAAHAMGNRWSLVRAVAAPAFLAGVPLLVWAGWWGDGGCGVAWEHILGVCAIGYAAMLGVALPRVVGAGGRERMVDEGLVRVRRRVGGRVWRAEVVAVN